MSQHDNFDSFEQDAAQQPAQPRAASTWQQNLKIFSKGTPRIVLIGCALVATVAFAAGIRNIASDDNEDEFAVSHVDIPSAPQSTHTTDPVSESIAAARAQVSNDEASDAYIAGRSYQPGFDVNIQPDSRLGIPTQHAQYADVPLPQQPVVSMQPVGVRPTQSVNTRPIPSSDTTNARIAEEEKQLEAELKKEQETRDQHVQQQKKEIVTEIERSYGSGADYLPDKSLGLYSSRVYYSAPVAGNPSGAENPSGAGNSGIQTVATKAAVAKKPLIKTGNVLYAESDAEINTDDGGEVMATIRGGEWDGSRLIGQLQQTPNNISIKFNVLAPQDNRPTMRINAVAIREEDAKLGIAENIDHHYIQRYAALAVSSLLGGAGRVFQTQGSSVFYPSGMVATTNGTPGDRQIIGSAAGELGQTLAQEFRKDVNRPSTYSSPAGQGFGVYFLDDVF
ncbi:MAG: DotG/IcmE/VirB10 family protein [Betaproteobacteria bacterium]|nr:DotG/IcmE/VirB10 family protein [Betaproteobacteria bacterium]